MNALGLNGAFGRGSQWRLKVGMGPDLLRANSTSHVRGARKCAFGPGDFEYLLRRF